MNKSNKTLLIIENYVQLPMKPKFGAFSFEHYYLLKPSNKRSKKQ